MKQIVALALTGVLASGTPAAAPDGEQEVPVLGSTVVSTTMESESAKATVLVNGVRRIDGATVVYYSVGLPSGVETPSWYDLNSTAYDRAKAGSGGSGNVRLVDFAGNRIYAPLARLTKYGSEEAIVSPTTAWPREQPGGVFHTFYAVLPQLPEDLRTVDVMVGHGDIVHDVVVEDGVLEPASLQEDPMVMGEVWPLIDQVAAKNSTAPEDSVRPLVARVGENG